MSSHIGSLRAFVITCTACLALGGLVWYAADRLKPRGNALRELDTRCDEPCKALPDGLYGYVLPGGDCDCVVKVRHKKMLSQ